MLSLNYRDARPIYEQVRDGLRHLVVTGAIAEGEKLPSIRALAATLAINPNTIQRAYAALEAEGYLITEPGRGAYAAHHAGEDDGGRKAELLQQFDSVTVELLFLGLTVGELTRRVGAAAASGGGAPTAPPLERGEEGGNEPS